jgi:hypothetical protein
MVTGVPVTFSFLINSFGRRTSIGLRHTNINSREAHNDNGLKPPHKKHSAREKGIEILLRLPDLPSGKVSVAQVIRRMKPKILEGPPTNVT